MSEPLDDKTFDEYLGRQSQLSKRYRALGAGEVPPELDRRVLAQAHEAVVDKSTRAHKRPAWMRWSAPLALAASAVLVVSIVIESGTQHEVKSSAVTARARQQISTSGSIAASQNLVKQEAASPQAPSVPQASQAPEPEAGTATVTLESRRTLARDKAASPAPADARAESEPVFVSLVPVVVVPPSFDIVMPAEEAPIAASNAADTAMAKRADDSAASNEPSELAEVAVVTGSRVQRRSAGQGVGPRDTIAPAAAADHRESDAASAQPDHEGDAPSWLEYIRQLRKDGRSRQADLEWKRFRAAYPEYPVNEKDAARARK